MQWSDKWERSKRDKVLIIKKSFEKLNESNKSRYVKIIGIYKIKEYKWEICWDWDFKKELFQSNSIAWGRDW